jgi:hypothetical protein
MLFCKQGAMNWWCYNPSVKKLWLAFLLLSMLSLNAAGWFAPARMACHTMTTAAHDECQPDQPMPLAGDCVQSCLSHYPGFPLPLVFSSDLAMKPVLNSAVVAWLPDPHPESPDKPPLPVLL